MSRLETTLPMSATPANTKERRHQITGHGEFAGIAADPQATSKAKCAVAEYLRDLGLKDPDVVAEESQRIVAEAQQQLSAADVNDPSVLCETAIRLTVKQLERWLEMLATQSGGRDHSPRMGSVMATRLPGLLDRFPQAMNGDGLPPELVDSLQTGITPVVPQPRPQRMRRQALPLIPSSLKRAAGRIHKLVFCNGSEKQS